MIPSPDVVLVNERDEPVGTMEKMEAHRKALLHRAFSVFIFNRNGDMLLQQRALHKYHSAGLWTNACCSHPYPGEDIASGAKRRLREEMGFVTEIEKAFDFIYKSPFENGLTEHEFDHVFMGFYDGPIEPNPEEVQAYAYKSLDKIRAELIHQPELYTSWFKIAFSRVEAWLKENGVHGR